MKSFWKKKYDNLLLYLTGENTWQTNEVDNKPNNYVRLIGRLYKNDPAMVITKNSKHVTNFTLVTEDKYKDKILKSFHFIELWDDLAIEANLELLAGMEINLEGSIKTTSYEQKGQKKYITKIIVNKFKIIDSKPIVKFINNHPDAAYAPEDLPF